MTSLAPMELNGQQRVPKYRLCALKKNLDTSLKQDILDKTVPQKRLETLGYI